MLRVALLLDGMMVERWKGEVVKAIKRTGHARIVLVVLGGTGSSPIEVGVKLKHAAFHAYCSLDQLLFPVQNDPLELTNISEEIEDAKVLKAVFDTAPSSGGFPQETLELIRAEKIDVLVCLGLRSLSGEVLHAAKYGVWRLHHGEDLTHPGVPACFWEVVDDHPTTGATVQLLSEELDGGRVLARMWCSTNRYSYGRTCAELYWNSVQMVPQLITRLDRDGFDALLNSHKGGGMRFYDRRSYRIPENFHGFTATTRILGRVAAKAVRRITSKEQWRLIYAVEKDLGQTALHQYQHLAPPKDRFWADPFVVKRDGHFHVFVEELIYSKKRGHISVITLDQSGKVMVGPRVVLREDYHLSYPFLFEMGERLFMVPESAASGALWLYECTEFPLVWKKVSCLMSGVIAVDPTICFYNGRWWLFANIADRPDITKHTHLHLFHSTDPTGSQWEPHCKNPIVSDARRARPAGRPFVHAGYLYRPSQDCAGAYGRGISINRVIALDQKEYHEVEDVSIKPCFSRNQIGIHTLNRFDDMTIFDALYRVPAVGQPSNLC